LYGSLEGYLFVLITGFAHYTAKQKVNKKARKRKLKKKKKKRIIYKTD